ncbi:MAG: 2-(1,2-epoxy-1,2-dihydrophenyl)acetyl-CoA isomerase [Alphaproteobacteria bacterium]|nr:MAG: 2-(1,2-epoxy-1,2-dihydrophenyl)acetyl-CoA isomerase [Alphaproteobacteria bacterium]
MLVSRDGPVTTISLNRPSRLNAFDASLRSELLAALSAAATDQTCRAVLLRAEGRGFSAGQDLADVAADADLGQLLTRDYVPLIECIRTMPKPVVCAVQGVAAGAGANLALCCDIVLAGETARFIQAFVRIGLIPDLGGTWVLPRLIGMARARAIAMLGDPVTAGQAEAWGMIYRVVADDDLIQVARALALRLTELPTSAIGMMKQAFDASATNDLGQQLALESELQSRLGHSADFAEGRHAFLEKRFPRFNAV